MSSTRLTGRKRCHITSTSCGCPHNRSRPAPDCGWQGSEVLHASWRLQGPLGNQRQIAWRLGKLACWLIGERAVWWTTNDWEGGGVKKATRDTEHKYKAACWVWRSVLKLKAREKTSKWIQMTWSVCWCSVYYSTCFIIIICVYCHALFWTCTINTSKVDVLHTSCLFHYKVHCAQEPCTSQLHTESRFTSDPDPCVVSCKVSTECLITITGCWCATGANAYLSSLH